ncbi:MAG TPA: type II toxin-antitoxin system RelE/ParE family toxin [Rhizobiaceae bacterium]
MRITEYLDGSGKSPFAGWFNSLDARAATKITVALTRIGQGNLSNVKSVGGGVAEYRIDFGPGYRIYFGREGDEVVILLAGGTKRRQQDDLRKALERWQDYKRRKKGV